MCACVWVHVRNQWTRGRREMGFSRCALRGVDVRYGSPCCGLLGRPPELLTTALSSQECALGQPDLTGPQAKWTPIDL